GAGVVGGVEEREINGHASFSMAVSPAVTWRIHARPATMAAVSATPRLDPAERRRFRRRLRDWYARHRRDLPWRRTSDPYHILVSEIMLQQTQVERVIPKYGELLEPSPTPHS